jgi:hypothetical protein
MMVTPDDMLPRATILDTIARSAAFQARRSRS